MSKGQVKFKYSRSGFNEFRKSPEVVEMLGEYADRIRGACGEGYFTEEKQMPTRAIASVYTGTYEAMVDNSDNNTIAKAVNL